VGSPTAPDNPIAQSRSVQWWAPALGVAGVVAAIAAPLVNLAQMRAATRQAGVALEAIHQAQEGFRLTGGRGGYASDLASLMTACPGDGQPALRDSVEAVPIRALAFEVRLRAAEGAQVLAVDCHQRPAASDYYASAAPRQNGVDGRQALAMTSGGRIFVFFDGVPPRQEDMGGGGLAVPLDTLSSFKIP
jgi:hypothetical protein